MGSNGNSVALPAASSPPPINPRRECGSDYEGKRLIQRIKTLYPVNDAVCEICCSARPMKSDLHPANQLPAER